MRRFACYELLQEGPPYHGKNHISITQLCHEKEALPSPLLHTVTVINNTLAGNAG